MATDTDHSYDERYQSTTPGHSAAAERARTALLAGFPLVNDHPDVAGVLRDPHLLGLLGAGLAAGFRDARVDKVVAPEARGPILGALVAVELGAGLVIVRKDERNHPGSDVIVQSATTWRGVTETFIARSFDISPGDRVLIVDDWITSGSSIEACRRFVEAAGGHVVGVSVIVNKATPDTLEGSDVRWLVGFDEVTLSEAQD